MLFLALIFTLNFINSFISINIKIIISIKEFFLINIAFLNSNKLSISLG